MSHDTGFSMEFEIESQRWRPWSVLLLWVVGCCLSAFGLYFSNGASVWWLLLVSRLKTNSFGFFEIPLCCLDGD
jgi:hypothetical protein